MVSFPKNLVEERKKNLPPHLKNALFSKEIGQKIVDIAKENGIEKREQIVKICGIIGYALLRFIHPKEIEKYLIEDLKLKENLVKDIASTLRIQILLDFPELFKEKTLEETPEETLEKTPKEMPEERMSEDESTQKNNEKKLKLENQIKENQEKISKQEKLELTNQTKKEVGKIESQPKKDPYLEPLDENIELKPVVVREQGRARKVF